MAGARNRMRCISVEEHFVIPELAVAWRALLASETADEPGFRLLADTVYSNPTPAMALINKRLGNLGDERIEYMDRLGIDVQLLMIAAPGVQVLDSDTATALARLANDRLAEAVRAHPRRFAGMATVAPQNPMEAARELERAVTRLDLRGAFIASHTKGEYLDAKKFWPIFATAARLDVPIYLHPREPSPDMLKAYMDYMLYFATWGFAAETGLHMMRLIFSGVFDEYPNLKIVAGHMGEGVTYWLDRIDSYHLFLVESGKQRRMAKLPSGYFRDNFVVTTSGMNSRIPLQHALEVLGSDRIMFAVDYPYSDGAADVAFLNGSALAKSTQHKILHGNAERLFKIG